MLKQIIARSGLTAATIQRRMAGEGAHVSYAAAYSWSIGRRFPAFRSLAVLLRVLGASDDERLLLFDFAEAPAARPAPAS